MITSAIAMTKRSLDLAQGRADRAGALEHDFQIDRARDRRPQERQEFADALVVSMMLASAAG